MHMLGLLWNNLIVMESIYVAILVISIKSNMAISKHKNTTHLRKHIREKEGRKRKDKSRKIHKHQPWICDDT